MVVTCLLLAKSRCSLKALSRVLGRGTMLVGMELG